MKTLEIMQTEHTRRSKFKARSSKFNILLTLLLLLAGATVWRLPDARTRNVGTGSRIQIAVTIHRLRQRFRELVREEVAQTVTNPAEFDEELKLLFG